MLDLQPPLTALGWGSTDASNPTKFASTLNVVVLDTITLQQCRAASPTYAHYVDETNKAFCTLSSGKDTCYGDSGGPLLARIDNNNNNNNGGGGNGAAAEDMLLAGLVSWSAAADCASPNFPAVNTDVTSLRSWVFRAYRTLWDRAPAIASADVQASNAAVAIGTTGTATPQLPILIAAATITSRGCTCESTWSTSRCSSSNRIQSFEHCGMATPCDGDDHGIQGLSWCTVVPGSCALSSLSWDYCWPDAERRAAAAAAAVATEPENGTEEQPPPAPTITTTKTTVPTTTVATTTVATTTSAPPPATPIPADLEESNAQLCASKVTAQKCKKTAVVGGACKWWKRSVCIFKVDAPPPPSTCAARTNWKVCRDSSIPGVRCTWNKFLKACINSECESRSGKQACTGTPASRQKTGAELVCRWLRQAEEKMCVPRFG